jgi:hypothetical protein
VSVADWLVPTSALVGAGLGAGLSYLGARAGAHSTNRATEQRESAGRREEWGRRFAAALSLLGEQSQRDRMIGRALLVQLLASDLATADDREVAAKILAADAVDKPTQAALRALPAGPDLQDVEFVQDDSGTAVRPDADPRGDRS